MLTHYAHQYVSKQVNKYVRVFAQHKKSNVTEKRKKKEKHLTRFNLI